MTVIQEQGEEYTLRDMPATEAEYIVTHVKESTGLDGSIAIEHRRYISRENTHWIWIKYDGVLPDGRAFDLIDEHPLLGDVISFTTLGRIIGFRVRRFILQYTAAAGEKQ